MFMGEYQHTLDPKGRIIVPAKFRELLGEIFVITKGIDHCLFVYPMNEWKIIEEKLKLLPVTRGDARAFVRFFLSGANECSLDKQGRILIPPNLRSYASLEKDVVTIGVSNRVEIWSTEVWEDYNKAAESSFAEIAEKLTDLEF
jgi:MraZ protein